MGRRRSLPQDAKKIKPSSNAIGDKQQRLTQTANGRHHKIDTLDTKIIDELLADADTSSSTIALKYRMPLSTIQRRRTALESMSVLKHEYNLDPTYFGFMTVQFWIMVQKGKAERVAQDIFGKFSNILEVRLHVNSMSNMGILAYVNSSKQLYAMIEEVKSMQFVDSIEFAEIVRVIGTRRVNFFKMTDRLETNNN